MRLVYFAAVIATAICLTGCSNLTRVDHVPHRADGKRDLVVFFDGTANDEGSRTNVAKLHNLVTLQNRPDISTTYIQGVGTGSKVIGMAAGWGVGYDVREAYLYLIENYDASHGDEISIFGFSRGAYASRILAALLYVAGIPDAKHLSRRDRETLVKDIYSAYKSEEEIKTRRKDVAAILLKKWGGKIVYHPQPVNVRFMGLWDSVEALGWPDLKENIGEPNVRYADQLCNVQAASHALSLDDNRARVFTPLLLSRKHLSKKCDQEKEKVEGDVNEVWFSGAHSDVGGGYKDTDIDGLSLNWMLAEMKKSKLALVPDKTRVYADFLGLTHNPEGGLFGLIYRERNRNISCYTQLPDSDSTLCKRDRHDIDYQASATPASGPLKLHPSVLDRLCVKPPEPYESFWFEAEKFKNCLTCDDDRRGGIADTHRCRQVLDVAKDNNYEPRNVQDNDNHCNYAVCQNAAGAAYQNTQSCNFNHSYAGERARQRLMTTYLNEPGDSTTIIVFADVKDDHSGVMLSKDRSYRFTIHGVEDWVDCTIDSTTPTTGRKTWDSQRPFTENLLSVIAKPIAYAPFSGYMELLGVVADQQFRLGRMAQDDERFTPRRNGELILRPNEPRLMKSVYQNNFGVLKLTIETID